VARRAARLAASALLLAAASGWLGRSDPGAVRLSVEDARGGGVLRDRTVAPGQRLVLTYLHSTSHTRVRGVFEVAPGGGLIARETSFGSFGPGLPALGAGDRYQIRDGVIRQVGLDQRLPELSLFVHPETAHVLEIGGETLELSRMLRPGALVRIRAGR
jgi:hypothetical protein